MGFFRFETWLVSNAHVIHDNSEIQEGLLIKKYDDTKTFLEVEQGYHRPWNSMISPDLVVLNTKDRHRSLPNAVLSLDETYPDKHFFYVDTQFQIQFLRPVSAPGELPMKFICANGSIPDFGCSGSPIFSAEVVIGKTPTWRFELIGAVYARHLSALCGIPIVQEFEQIRQIIISTDSSARHRQRMISSEHIGDAQQAQTSQILAERDEALATAGIQVFNAGHSILHIELPEGLERLAKNTYAKLTESYLQSIKGLSLEQVQNSFIEFIDHIKQHQSLYIKYDTDTPVLETKYWRLDCKPGGQNGLFRILQIQDNTGKTATVPGTGKSASSIFAQIKVLKNIHYINGEPLSDDLILSHKAIEQDQAEHEVSIILDFTAMASIKCQKYRLMEKRTASPSLRLFKALPLTNLNGQKELQQFITAEPIVIVEKINGVNSDGDTPLMVLLKKPLKDTGQRAKAKLLVPFSIWNQPNLQGKTATNLLREHSDADDLSNYFELN